MRFRCDAKDGAPTRRSVSSQEEGIPLLLYQPHEDTAKTGRELLQELNLLAPWPWNPQASELWEINVISIIFCCSNELTNTVPSARWTEYRSKEWVAEGYFRITGMSDRYQAEKEPRNSLYLGGWLWGGDHTFRCGGTWAAFRMLRCGVSQAAGSSENSQKVSEFERPCGSHQF